MGSYNMVILASDWPSQAYHGIMMNITESCDAYKIARIGYETCICARVKQRAS